MDGGHVRRFFLEPRQTFQRRYEALRAIFVDDEPIERVAERFGYTPASLRSMASRLRADCRRGVATPFFSRTAAGGPSEEVQAEDGRVPRHPTSRTVAS
jgi:SOS-response transcriptional repressor LexA